MITINGWLIMGSGIPFGTTAFTTAIHTCSTIASTERIGILPIIAISTVEDGAGTGMVVTKPTDTDEVGMEEDFQPNPVAGQTDPIEEEPLLQ